MRIKIAMCDDNAKMLPVIAGAARSAFHAKGMDVDISMFTSGQKLLASLEENHYNLMLLDIEMPGMDGIAIGKKLRAMGDDTKIVFVSEAESRVFESFQVQPLGFVRKSNFLNDITAAEIILSDGASIPVGRSKAGEVKAKFLSLVGK